jgi:hypothetical protein
MNPATPGDLSIQSVVSTPPARPEPAPMAYEDEIGQRVPALLTFITSPPLCPREMRAVVVIE